MSQFGSGSFAAFLLRNRSGKSQAVVGVLLSREEDVWSVAVSPSAAEGRTFTTDAGLAFVAVEVPDGGLLEALPENLEQLSEGAEEEAI